MASLPDTRNRFQIDCGLAQLHVHARSMATVLRLDGEVDMSNADQVGQAIRRFCRLNAPLILDLSHMEFLGATGFRTLLNLSDENEQAQRHCSMVGGEALGLLTRVFTDCGLPLADSVPDALDTIDEYVSDRRRLDAGDVRQREPQRKTPSVDATSRALG